MRCTDCKKELDLNYIFLDEHTSLCKECVKRRIDGNVRKKYLSRDERQILLRGGDKYGKSRN